MEEGVVYVFSIAKLYSAKRAISQAGFTWFVFFLSGTKFIQGQFMNCICGRCENLWEPWVEMLVFPFLPSGLRVFHGQGSWTKWMDAYVGILRTPPTDWYILRSRCTSISTLSSQLVSVQALPVCTAVIELSAMRTACLFPASPRLMQPPG